MGTSEKEREKKRESPPLFFLSLSLFSLPTTESLEQASDVAYARSTESGCKHGLHALIKHEWTFHWPRGISGTFLCCRVPVYVITFYIIDRTHVCFIRVYVNARALIGQSAMVYCAGKLMEKSRVFCGSCFLHFPRVLKCPSCFITVQYTAQASLVVK